MIIFDLKCVPEGHVFEGWFGSSADYDAQRQGGLLSCPLCGAAEVVKAVMAPAVGAKSNRASNLFSGDPATVKQMMAAIAAEQKKMLEGSEHVGDRFADEARAIHLGESDARSIHGRATRAEAIHLAEEGIAVAPLPFPVAAPSEEN
jgi:hypothetical protein